MQYVFGAFVLDTDQYELRCHGEPVALEPKAYQVLTYLVQHRDRLVTQHELLAQAWPDVAVDRLAVARCISLIRRTVGDSADTQQVIQTRRGHGYRFVAEVTEQETISSSITPSEVPASPAVSAQDASAPPSTERSCPSCQQANPPTARFCMACGVPLIVMCTACTQTVALPAAFCPSCGQPLAPRPIPEASTPVPEDARLATPPPHAEHKVVSICYGHFSLASDPPETLDREALHDLQQAIAQMVAEVVQPYGGELYELDSRHLVVVFGVPEAMEDHAQRAVFAALLLLQHDSDHAFVGTPPQVISSPTRLAWHIGIHSGTVVAGQNPSELQRAITVSGDVLQGAAALAHQADPGTLLLSEATSRWVHDDIQLQPVAPVPISGWPQPLLAFRVAVPPSVPFLWTTRAMRQHTRFIGRGAELERLHHHLDLVFEGQGQIVSLVGEPGIGKTRLVTEFIHAERGRPMTCLISSCHAYGQHTPYLPLVTLLRQLFARNHQNTPGHLRDSIQDTLQSLDMATEENLSVLLHLLDNPVTAAPPNERDPQQRRQQTFAVLHQLLSRLSQHHSLLLAIDDLHWIDATSLAFLGEFSEHIGGAPVFLLVSARPGYQPFWLTVSYVTQLSLAGLTEDEGRDVVQSVGAATPLNVSTRQQIIAKAQGNPLFLEELTQAVIEHGHDVTLAVPDTVQAVLSARIDRLPSDTKQLLMIAAVIGPEAPLSLLHDIAALPEGDLNRHLRHLRTAEFLHVTGYGADATVVFKHILTQEVAYQSLLTRHRQQLHQQIAQTWVERFPERVEQQPEWVASHYTEAGLIEQAMMYWQLAGERANDRSAYVEAITHLQTGLTLLATLPETSARIRRELSLKRALVSAQIVTKGYTAPEVVQTYARMYALCQQLEEDAELFPILLELARFDSQRGELPRSRATGERLLAIAIRQQDAVRLQQAHWMLGQTLHYLGDIDPAHTHLAQSLRFYIPQAFDSHTGRELAGVQIASLFFESLNMWALGYPEQALTHSREALAIAQALEHPFTLSFAHYGLVRIHQLRREPQAVLEQVQFLLALASDQNFSPYLARGKALEGWALAQQGQVEAGIDQLQRCLDGKRHEIDAVVRMMFLMLLADVCCQQQHAHIGLEALSDALVAVEQTGLRFHVAELHRLRGTLALHQEAPDEGLAETCFQRALEIAQHQQAQSWALRASVSSSQLWRQQGKSRAAHALLANIYNRFTEGFDTPDLQEAQALLESLM